MTECDALHRYYQLSWVRLTETRSPLVLQLLRLNHQKMEVGEQGSGQWKHTRDDLTVHLTRYSTLGKEADLNH